MSDILKLTLWADVKVYYEKEVLRFHTPTLAKYFAPASIGIQKAVDVLQSTGATEDNLMDIILDEDGFEGLMQFSYILNTLRSVGFLVYEVRLNEETTVKLLPLSRTWEYRLFEPEQGAKYKLSKLSLLRKKDDLFAFESPIGRCEMVFENAAIAPLFLSLYTAKDLKQWVSESGYDADAMSAFLTFLFNMDCIQKTDAAGQIDEDILSNPEAYWELHDIYFHAKTRMGRHKNPYGGTFPFGEQTVIPSALKEIHAESVVKLFAPDMNALKATDMTLTAAIEGRKSFRAHGDKPITANQLGEFLYRTSRISGSIQLDQYEFARKNYPAGGGLYELEVYPVISKCEGVDSGLYYYDPQNHQLALMRQADEHTNFILALAGKTGMMEDLPQVLFVITARFQRLSHKYRSIAYALILKHVGVLYMEMYLVATAMNLAPCALGGGDSDLFAEIANLDYMQESSVGEFILGSR